MSKVNYRADIGGPQKTGHTVESVFNGVIEKAEQLLLQHSFYVPKSMLRDSRFIFYEIQVVEQRAFRPDDFRNLSYEGAPQLVLRARYVGISKRRRVGSPADYTVAKVWYGEKP